jgi:hypothetical protein
MVVEALPQAPLVHWAGQLHKVMGDRMKASSSCAMARITVLDSQPLITTIAGNQPVTRSLFSVSAPCTATGSSISYRLGPTSPFLFA